MGLTEDELAFYDLLSSNERLINEKGPIQDLVHQVVASVKKNLQLDWAKKEDALATIRLAVKKELSGKVPFSQLNNLLKEVLEQAEGQVLHFHINVTQKVNTEECTDIIKKPKQNQPYTAWEVNSPGSC